MFSHIYPQRTLHLKYIQTTFRLTAVSEEMNVDFKILENDYFELGFLPCLGSLIKILQDSILWIYML